jgi:hypothetical protein
MASELRAGPRLASHAGLWVREQIFEPSAARFHTVFHSGAEHAGTGFPIRQRHAHRHRRLVLMLVSYSVYLVFA